MLETAPALTWMAVPRVMRAMHCSVQEYIDRLPHYDADMDAMLNAAIANDQCLRYVGAIYPEQSDAALRATVGIHQCAAAGPFGTGRLNGADNIAVIRTQWYDALPLVIQGPGAGAAVTAAGVFSDILKATQL
jgi:bifunctional aspartokinase / homoserine dehydrogenase 1